MPSKKKLPPFKSGHSIHQTKTTLSMWKYSLFSFFFPMVIVFGVCWLFHADLLFAVPGSAILNALLIREWFNETNGREATWTERNAFILQNGVMCLAAAFLAWVDLIRPLPYPGETLIIMIVLSETIPLFASFSLIRPVKRKTSTLTRTLSLKRKQA